MKRILFVSTRPPFPLLSGEKNKTFNEIKILSKKYEVIYCGLCPKKDRENVVKLLTPFCQEVHLFEMGLLNSLIGTFLALFSNLPLQIGYFQSSKLKNFVERKSSDVDAVFVNLFRAVQYVVNVKKPMFLDMSDSISEHYKKAIEVTSSPFWKLIYSLEARRMRSYEERNLILFKKVFLFNPEELKLYKANNLRWIPHGVNQKIVDYKGVSGLKKNNKISFFGKMDYRPNIEAVKWFAQNVMPLLDEKFTFQIIGAFPSPEVLKLKAIPRVEVIGFVEDPYALLRGSFCVVAPMISGGGIQNKLLESMSIGCVNIVSSLCARPLINLGNEIIVADTPLMIVEAINNLEVESAEYARLSESSRDYILKNYTWDKFEEVLFSEVAF